MTTPPFPRIARRRSRLHGWGVFALEPITKNTRIVHYAGELIAAGTSKAREADQLGRGHIWCFSVNRRWVRDAEVGGNVARFVNHACRPNCYSQVVGQTIWIRAARNIRRGEELTYNYYTHGTADIPCNCVPGCTNRL
jgi:SET domain-containing protein